MFEDKKVSINDILINVMIILIPFQSFVGNFFQIVISLISCIYLFFASITHAKIEKNYYYFGYFGLMVIAMLSLGYSNDLTSTKAIILQVIPIFLFITSLYLYLSTKDRISLEKLIEKKLTIFLWATVSMCFILLVLDAKNFGAYYRFARNIFKPEHYSRFSYYLIISYCISFFKMLSSNKKINLYIWITLFVFSISFFTGIRKAIILPLVFSVLFFAIRSKDIKKFIINMVYILLFSLFILLGIIFSSKVSPHFYDTVVMKVYSLFQSFISKGNVGPVDQSLLQREMLASAAWQSFKEAPFLGYGFGAFRNYAASKTGLFLYAHNNYLELLASTGILGFLSYYLPIFYMMSRSLITKNKSNLVVFFSAISITLLFSDIGTVSYLTISYPFIYILMGSLFSEGRQLNEKET